MSGRPTIRLTVADGGRMTCGELLHAISAKASYEALYGDAVPAGVEAMLAMPPYPTADGVYLLIDNKWVPGGP